jgi:CTP:molybdopterin cytidylyltransferase MocA
MTLAAIITAAGQSRRMGQSKALLRWGDSTLITHQVTTLAAFPFTRLIVVTGYDATALTPYLAPLVAALPALRIAHNPHWETGRSSTFEVAAAALTDLMPTRALVIAVDQPLSSSVVAALVSHPDHEATLVPTFEGRRGHPILLSPLVVAALATASAHPGGLRDLIRLGRTTEVSVDSPSIHLDLNTPEAYAAAHR